MVHEKNFERWPEQESRIPIFIEPKKCQCYTLKGICVCPLNDHYVTLIFLRKYMIFEWYYPNICWESLTQPNWNIRNILQKIWVTLKVTLCHETFQTTGGVCKHSCMFFISARFLTCITKQSAYIFSKCQML